MITGRNVILASITLFVLAMILNIAVLLQPLDNDGRGFDSYGVYSYGHRGLVEVLQSVELPVERSHSPFDSRIGYRATYVLVGPDVGLLDVEEGVIRQLEQWVRNGGRLVIGFSDGWPSAKFMKYFAVQEVQFVDFKTGEPLHDLNEDEIPNEFRKFLEGQKKRRESSLGDDLSEIVIATPPEYKRFHIAERSGIFHSASHSVGTIALREGGQVAINTGETHPNSVLAIQNSEQTRTLMAEYNRGKGSVILVADVSVFHNLSLREGDNSVLLVDVLSKGREHVYFDEFFHGLSIRGNPIWIFAQPGYRVIALLLLAAVVLFIWHELPSFGAVFPPEDAPRRTLEVYLDAVSRLLIRARPQLEKLLIESKDVFLWRMARCLRLSGERHQQEAIRNRLRRTNPQKLEEFVTIIAEYERYHHEGCSSKELIFLLRRSHRCLS